jgi:L-threonylcarbamoyladenylate synthase
MKTEILNIADKNDTIHKAVSLLQKGEVIAVPTDTVYGLAADYSNQSAISKIYQIKQRSYNKPLSIAVASLDDVQNYAEEIPQSFYILANAFLPGALSIILNKKQKEFINLKQNQNIRVRIKTNINIRFVDNEVTNAIIKELGKPIALTSANKSGKKPCTDAQCVLENFNGEIRAIIDGGKTRLGIESTIISLIEEKPKIIREACISKSQIEKVLGYSIL